MKRLSLLSLVLMLALAAAYPQAPVVARSSAQDMLFATVKVVVIDQEDHGKAVGGGSGLVIADSRILTAMHVVSPVIRDSERYDVEICINFTNDQPPDCWFAAERVGKYSEKYDLAEVPISQGWDDDLEKYIPFGQFKDKYRTGEYLSPKNYINTLNAQRISLGDDLTVLGYPAVGGEAITLTKGVVSGIQKEAISGVDAISLIRTDAKVNHGNSGGPAFNALGEFLGIATATATDISDIGHIVPVAPIKDFLRSPQERIQGEICYDYANGYKEDGECFCDEDYAWDKQLLYCAEVKADPVDAPANTQGGDDTAAPPPTPTPEPTPAAEAEATATPLPTDNSTPAPETDVPVLTESETQAAQVLRTTLRTVIIATLTDCKADAQDDRSAYRACLKTRIKDFILETSRAKRALTAVCREEGATDDDSLRACLVAKIQASAVTPDNS